MTTTAQYEPRPGDYAVVKTGGLIGRLIRIGTTSRWNHNFIYLGDDLIIEARPIGVKFGKASKYNILAYNKHEDLTSEQRKDIVDFAIDQVGKSYGYLDIFILFLRILGLGLPPSRLWVRLAKRQGYICSELVAEAYAYADFTLRNKPDALVTPGDLAERLIYQ
jgi:hypothetical protein